MNAYDKNIFENLPPQTATLNIVASYLKKYLLKETEDMLLYQQNCSTVLRESTELVDNEKNIEQNEERIIHRRSDVETQTYYSHSKTRFVHTEYVAKSEIGCFVSNYDMHDTYINLEYTTESVRIDADDHQEQLKIITYSKEDNNDLNHYLESNKSFQLSSMILQRILAGNIFYTKQKRFRNMSQVESPDLMPKYSYQIKLLCKYNEAHCNAISSMSWNPKNADILAIGYGVFKIQVQTECRSSAVCLWNIKVNPFLLRYYIISYIVTQTSIIVIINS